MLKRLPRVKELVIATVTYVDEYGAKARLEEYGGLEAFIPRSHVTSARIRNIRDYVREGQVVVARVLRVDKVKQEVDLSLKFVSDIEQREKLAQWKRYVRAVKLIELAIKREGLNIDKEQILSKILEVYRDPLAALEEAAKSGSEELIKLGVPPALAERITNLAKERLAPPTYRLEYIVKLVSYEPNGVEIIRDLLLKTRDKIESAGLKPKITNIGSPRYMVIAESKDPKKLSRTMKKAIEELINEIQKLGGEGEILSERKK